MPSGVNGCGLQRGHGTDDHRARGSGQPGVREAWPLVAAQRTRAPDSSPQGVVGAAAQSLLRSRSVSSTASSPPAPPPGVPWMSLRFPTGPDSLPLGSSLWTAGVWAGLGPPEAVLSWVLSWVLVAHPPRVSVSRSPLRIRTPVALGQGLLRELLTDPVSSQEQSPSEELGG